MNPYQMAVQDFHAAMNMPIGTKPELNDCELRAKLIMEEAVETVAAMGFHVEANIEDPIKPDPQHYQERLLIASFVKDYREPVFEDVIDGMVDLLYVVFGAAVTMGLDLDPFFEEVHKANMLKSTGPKREDGKQLKPEGWQPPNHGPILERMLYSGR